MSADPIHVAAELVVTSDARGRERADFAAKAFLSRYGVATTRKGYALALSQWFQWCDEHFVDPLAAKRYHIASTGHADGRMVEYYDRGRDKVERNVTHGLAAYVERAT